MFAAGWSRERYASPGGGLLAGLSPLSRAGVSQPGPSRRRDRPPPLGHRAQPLPEERRRAVVAARETRALRPDGPVPAPEDLLCIALAHSYLSDRSEAHDWAVDARGARAAPRIRLVASSRRVAHRRGVDALVGARLRCAAGDARARAAGRASSGSWTPDSARRSPPSRARGSSRHRKPWRVRADRRARQRGARRCAPGASWRSTAERPPRRSRRFPAACAWLRLDAPLPEGFPVDAAHRGRSRSPAGSCTPARAPRFPTASTAAPSASPRAAPARDRRRSQGRVHWIRVTRPARPRRRGRGRPPAAEPVLRTPQPRDLAARSGCRARDRPRALSRAPPGAPPAPPRFVVGWSARTPAPGREEVALVRGAPAPVLHRRIRGPGVEHRPASRKRACHLLGDGVAVGRSERDSRRRPRRLPGSLPALLSARLALPGAAARGRRSCWRRARFPAGSSRSRCTAG